VAAQAVSGLALFADDDDRRRFVQLLTDVGGNGLVCRAYCLMGTHYHLVLDGSPQALGVGMQRLNWRYARYFNRRHGRSGHVFAERYSAYVVRDEIHLEATLRYLQANPVKAGLCAAPDHWPWTWVAAQPVTGTVVPVTAVPAST